MNTIADLIFTLELCKRLLPGDANPVHFERLTEIERRLRELREHQEIEHSREDTKEPGKEGQQCRKLSAS